MPQKKGKRRKDSELDPRLIRCHDCNIVLRSVKVNKGRGNKTRKKAIGIHICVRCGYTFDTKFYDVENHRIEGRKCYVKLRGKNVAIPFRYSEKNRKLIPDGDFADWKKTNRAIIDRICGRR